MDTENSSKVSIKKKPHRIYDKVLIKKLVKLVEDGNNRQQLIDQYGMTYGTLCSWMQRYGSESYQKLKPKAYSNLQKRTICAAIYNGQMTIQEACKSFNVKHNRLIRKWLQDFKSEKIDLYIENKDHQMDKKKQPKNAEVEALKKALEEAELKIYALNTLIDVAEDQLKIKIRKKSGAKQLKK